MSPLARLPPKIKSKGRDLYPALETWCKILLESLLEVSPERLNTPPKGLDVSPAGLYDTTYEGLRIPKTDKTLARGTQCNLGQDYLKKTPKGSNLYRTPNTWCQLLLEGSLEIPPERLNTPLEGLNVSTIGLHDTTSEGLRFFKIDIERII